MKSSPVIPFSRRLRESTRKAHGMAERAGFIRGFLRGVVDLQNYRQLLTDYYYVYEAMEEVMAQVKHPTVRAIHFSELERVPALAQDLRHFAGPGWKLRRTPSPAARSYIARIWEVAQNKPELLVAHSYTRYLGDLSGGQILKKILVGALDLPAGQGVAFYEFPEISNHAAFKQKFRQAMDDLPLDESTQEEIIAEANLVFGLNTAVFAELEGNAWDSVVSIISHAFAIPLRAA